MLSPKAISDARECADVPRRMRPEDGAADRATVAKLTAWQLRVCNDTRLPIGQFYFNGDPENPREMAAGDCSQYLADCSLRKSIGDLATLDIMRNAPDVRCEALGISRRVSRIVPIKRIH